MASTFVIPLPPSQPKPRRPAATRTLHCACARLNSQVSVVMHERDRSPQYNVVSAQDRPVKKPTPLKQFTPLHNDEKQIGQHRNNVDFKTSKLKRIQYHFEDVNSTWNVLSYVIRM